MRTDNPRERTQVVLKKLSIVVPVLNEAQRLPAALAALQPLRADGHEVIVADGGSTDACIALATPHADRVIRAPQGRASQMNAGARAATEEALVFLHADTELPPQAALLIERALQHHGWGRFDVRLSGRHFIFRVIERLMNWRSRLSGIATGDQGVFVRRDWFDAVGGFPDIALMEDIALSRRLKSLGRPCCLRATVVTSSRRWETNGIARTTLLMWKLRLAYFLGADPRRLAASYYRARNP